MQSNNLSRYESFLKNDDSSSEAPSKQVIKINT